MDRDVRTRAEWGAKYESIYQKRRKDMPVSLPARYFLQHISVTFDTGTLVGDFYEDMQTLERIGYQRFGSGISYNWGVDAKTGMIGEGMPLDAKGTHTINEKNIPGYPFNLNYYGHAIAIIGMPGVVPSAECIKSVGAIIRAEWDTGVATRNCPYLPHNFFANKECPTQNIVNIMDDAYRIAQNWSPWMELSEKDKEWFRDTMRTIVKEAATTSAIAKAVKAEIPDLQIANIRTEVSGDTIGMNTMLRDIYKDTDDIKRLIRAHHVEPAQDLPSETEL